MKKVEKIHECLIECLFFCVDADSIMLSGHAASKVCQHPLWSRILGCTSVIKNVIEKGGYV